MAHHQDEEAYHGARKYLVYLMGTSKLFLLPAMILTYVLCGTLDFRLGDIAGGIFPPDANPTLVTITYVLYVAGLAKAAIMPLHNWLPSAMVAPTPVSALLHAVAVVKAGVFSICRVLLSAFGVDLMEHLGLGEVTAVLRRPDHRARLGHRAHQGRPQGAAGLLHGEPALLRRAGGRDADAARP